MNRIQRLAAMAQQNAYCHTLAAIRKDRAADGPPTPSETLTELSEGPPFSCAAPSRLRGPLHLNAPPVSRRPGPSPGRLDRLFTSRPGVAHDPVRVQPLSIAPMSASPHAPTPDPRQHRVASRVGRPPNPTVVPRSDLFIVGEDDVHDLPTPEHNGHANNGHPTNGHAHVNGHAAVDSPKASLRRLTYASHRAEGMTDKRVLDEIVLPSIRHNQKLAVTGCLWFDPNRFFHVLEGPQEAVQMLWGVIAEDQRHRNVQLLSTEAIRQRRFDQFYMRNGGGFPCEPLKVIFRDIDGAGGRKPATIDERVVDRAVVELAQSA